MKGVDIGETYHNKDAAREFTHYIAQAEREKMKERYNCGKFLTLLFTSIQMAPVTALFAVKGQVHVNFLEVQSVSKADADHIDGTVDASCQRLDK